ncbi:MAG TPA: DNA translocase FtsK, partial [Fibrobacteria bacterium]|nr:DNA translocase FtsK [Fibrobacteria bacterium]
MKKTKRLAKKPSNRAKGRAAASVETPDPAAEAFWIETWGLVLLAGVLVSAIALVSEFASPGGGNLLGPWLGTWWAGVLNRAVGSLPVIFLMAAMALLGLKLILARNRHNARMILVLFLLFISSGILLSVRNIAKARLTDLDFQTTGGYFGNFLVKKVFVPVFGQGQFGPYFITALGIFFVLVWGFRLSMVALSEKTATSMVVVLRPFFQGLSRLRARPPREENMEDPALVGTMALLPGRNALLKSAARGATLGSARSDGTVLPAPRKRAAIQDAPPAAFARGAGKSQPQPDQDVEVPPSRKNRVLSKEDLVGPDGELPEGLEDFDDLDLSDPLTIRKLRDLDLERKRVSELNEWEVKTRNPEIAGLLLKEKARREQVEEEDLASPAKTTKKKGRKKAEAELEEDVEAAVLDSVAPDSESHESVGVEDRAEPDSGMEDGEDAAEASSVPARLRPAPKPKLEVKYDVYKVPALDAIFEEPPKQPLEFTEEELREQSKLLEDQLINFKVMGKVTQICPGPVITRYEVELAPGVKVSRIATLADDLALALRAKSIRILAPIPGKSVVGIEVPNRKAQIVYIKEILKATEFAYEEDTLKICLGKTIAGEPYVMDLARAPHLLIAGQTGSGKSVCINSIMASFLLSKTPDELRMILVDPKVVELKPYDSIPHLMYPVITQPDVAVSALKWATVEMDRRYEVLAQCGVRNIKGFNAKVKEDRLPESMDDEDKKKMAYIVIIIDELADLMMVAGKEVETNIARIAQKARAVGIHLILATQRPSTNVITGTIKANLPTRIAFQVASQIDARTIMDKMGAEKLLGRGDMLFRPIEFPEPVRLHGCFLDDAQAEKMAAACSEQHVNYPQIQSFSLEDDPSAEGADDEPRDELFREAAELVVQVKQASVSLLQRRLGIGYARSGRLVDQLERAGVVGKERGSKPREVLMDSDELQ